MTIALVVEQGFGARVLLQSQVLSALSRGDSDVVILTPDVASIRAYLDEHGLEGVAVETMSVDEYDRHDRGNLASFLKRCRGAAVRCQTVDDMFKMSWSDAIRAHRPKEIVMLVAVWALSRLMRISGPIMRAVVGYENRRGTLNAQGDFFERRQPGVVVTTSLGTFDHDHMVIREAKRHGVQVASYVLSWDNTTVRGLGCGLSDRVLVWSEVMQRELVELHRVPASAVVIAGVPHYDAYVAGDASGIDKATLGQQLGFDPGKRLILVGTKSPNAFLYNADITALLCSAIRDGQLPQDCHVVARLHPIYMRRINGQSRFSTELAEWESLEGSFPEQLTVDYPTVLPSRLNYFMPDGEIPKLGALLRHSSVVVNMFSTLNLEASIFDTPTVNVAFQFEHRVPLGDKVARFGIHYDERQTHNQRVVRSGATSVAHSAPELLALVNAHLEHPEAHRQERAHLVAQECGANQGKAAAFVAQEILDMAGLGALAGPGKLRG